MVGLPKYFPNPIYCKIIESIYANLHPVCANFYPLSQPLRDNSPVSSYMKIVLSPIEFDLALAGKDNELSKKGNLNTGQYNTVEYGTVNIVIQRIILYSN